jgi:hypothetical protein
MGVRTMCTCRFAIPAMLASGLSLGIAPSSGAGSLQDGHQHRPGSRRIGYTRRH